MPNTDNMSQSSPGDSIARYFETATMDSEGALKSIKMKLDSITSQDGILISQSSLKDLAQQEAFAAGRESSRPSSRSSTASNRNASGRGRSDDNYARERDEARNTGRRRGKSFFDDVTDSFEEEFKKALFGSSNTIKNSIDQAIAGFAKELGTNVDGLGKTVGEMLGKRIGDSFKKSPIGDRLSREWQFIGDQFSNISADLASRAAKWLKQGQNSESGGLSADDIVDTSATITDLASGAREFVGNLGRAGEGAATASTEIAAVGQTAARAGTSLAVAGEGAAAAGEGAAAAGAAFPVLTVALIAGAIVIDKFTETFGPAIEGFKAYAGAMKEAGNYVQSQNKKNIEYYNARVKEDYNTIVRKPFELLAEAAESAASTWDAVLRTVSATQGYDKAGVQELWKRYAERLQEEGLDKVVSSSDIMSSLESVLKQGLSGKVAEEFAFIATKLNSAIPTEDFFQYASTYASIAANAVKNGASQEEALKIANSELGSFASNLLYASRELSGGFSTKLTNAASLFEESTKIAMTSRTGDISNISGVLTSVAATVGAIAPDLADGIVTAVTSAAMGGNSSNLTALRSLAGVGASNSVFLQELAKNPQKIFSTLFTNLAGMQGMSKDNYMEVAEALSGVFGISMDAFARVDFAYLADSINSMQLNDKSLEQNMQALVTGQTTTNEEQLKMQQVNQYMIDEGLAYVLDNEVARSIQQHMWDEQMKRELQETEYAVNIQGDALEFLQGIKDTADNIRNFLNPVSWFKKAGNMVMQTVKAEAMQKDLATIVEQGKVGNGNATAFSNLTANSPKDLSLTHSYVELMGAQSSVKAVDAVMKGFNTVTHQTVDSASKVIDSVNNVVSGIANAFGFGSSGGGGGASFGSSKSKYNFNMVGKSATASSGSWAARTRQPALKAIQTSAGDELGKGVYYTYDKEGNKVANPSKLDFSTTDINKLISGYVNESMAQSEKLEAGVKEAYNTAKNSRSTRKQAESEAEKIANEAKNDAKVREAKYKEIYKKLESAALIEKRLQEEEKKIIQNAIDSGAEVTTTPDGNTVLKNKVSSEEWDEVYTDKKGNLKERTVVYSMEDIADTTQLSALAAKASKWSASQGDWSDKIDVFRQMVNGSSSGGTNELVTEAASTASEVAEAVIPSIQLSEDDLAKLREQANEQANAAMEEIYKSTKASALKSELEKGFDIKKSYLSGETIQKSLSEAITTAAKDKNFDQNRTFEGFVGQLASQMGPGATAEDVYAYLSDYGYTAADLENMYAARESEATAQKEHAKEMQEAQLWEDLQLFIDGYFPVDFVEKFLTADWKLKWENDFLTPIRDDLKTFLKEWKNYYIHHTAYGEETRQAYQTAAEVAKKEKSGTGNAVLALAEALTKDTIWKQENSEKMNDPVLQANTLLAQILLVTEAIRNQTNETSVVSIPTALSSLGLGATTPSGTKKTK